MKPKRKATTTPTSNLKEGFCTIVNGEAIRLMRFAIRFENRDYWWTETLFVQYPKTQMTAFRHGSSYRPLHVQHR